MVFERDKHTPDNTAQSDNCKMSDPGARYIKQVRNLQIYASDYPFGIFTLSYDTAHPLIIEGNMFTNMQI